LHPTRRGHRPALPARAETCWQVGLWPCALVAQGIEQRFPNPLHRGRAQAADQELLPFQLPKGRSQSAACVLGGPTTTRTVRCPLSTRLQGHLRLIVQHDQGRGQPALRMDDGCHCQALISATLLSRCRTPSCSASAGSGRRPSPGSAHRGTHLLVPEAGAVPPAPVPVPRRRLLPIIGLHPHPPAAVAGSSGSGDGRGSGGATSGGSSGGGVGGSW
jgi:hypothetical protein